MRQMPTIAFFGIALSFVAGCATPAERREARLNESRAVCGQMGFQYGTPEQSQCTMQLFAQREAAQAAASAQMIQVDAIQQPAPPTIINR